MKGLRLLSLAISIALVAADVTVYSTSGNIAATATATDSAGLPTNTHPAHYDNVTLNAPAIPSPAPASTYEVNLGSNPAGLSIQVPGAFMGFSIEMSVSNQVLGKNSTLISPIFLNLLSNIKQRAGRVVVRIGGNSQENAVLVDSLPDGKVIAKDIENTANPTETPALDFTADLIYMMSNISTLVDVSWYLGIPWYNTNPFRLEIAQLGLSILGDRLAGLQAANEPDLLARHGHRPENYGPYDYFGEFGDLLKAMQASNLPTDNILIGPSISLSAWNPEQVWDTGYITTYAPNLRAISVERYPASNCEAVFGIGSAVNSQQLFETMMQHKSATDYVAPYRNSAALAVAAGKPFIVMEWNTAACSGFPGLADSFGAALWALDTGLQMASANFSGAMLHVGGQNAYYNPFTAPPTNESTFRQWSVGPVYYSALVMAEALGATNKSQVIDIGANNGSNYTPGYAIYQDGAPVRVALFNYITDSSGNSDVTANVRVSDGTGSVKVKYLRAESVAQKGNISWAGQTFGSFMESDGRPTGTEDIQTATCTSGTCAIKVPAPGFALVFLTDQALSDSTGPGGAASVATYSTSVFTKVTKTRGGAAATRGSGNGAVKRGGSVAFLLFINAIALLVLG